MNLLPEQKQAAVKTAQDDVPSLQSSIKSSLNDQ